MALEVTGLRVAIDVTPTKQAEREYNASLDSMYSKTRTVTDQVKSAFSSMGQGARTVTDQIKSYFSGVGDAVEQLKNQVFSLRGVIETAAAGIGIGELVEHMSHIENLRASMMGLSTDSQELADHWEFLNRVGQALGLRVDDMAAVYRRAMVSAREFGLSQDQGRLLFEAAATAARAMGTGVEGTNSIMEKFSMMLEAVRLQGSRMVRSLSSEGIPALAEAAKGFGISLDEMRARLETNSVNAADFLLKLAPQIIKDFSAAANQGANSISAWKDRVLNALDDLLRDTGDSGPIAAIKQDLKDLEEFLRSSKAREIAQEFGQVLRVAFNLVGDALDFVSKHTDLVIAGFSALAGLQLINWLGSVAQSASILAQALFGVAEAELAVESAGLAGGGLLGGLGRAAGGIVAEGAAGASAAEGFGRGAIRLAGEGAALAKGGVFGPQGNIPLAHYAEGGVARKAQHAVFGEGSLPEAFIPMQDRKSVQVQLSQDQAFVPLPGGRSIPVTLRGNMPAAPASSNMPSGADEEMMQAQRSLQVLERGTGLVAAEKQLPAQTALRSLDLPDTLAGKVQSLQKSVDVLERNTGIAPADKPTPATTLARTIAQPATVSGISTQDHAPIAQAVEDATKGAMVQMFNMGGVCYAGGGVSSSPAIFGEAGPEAAVPLPDGRTIPVTIRGGSGGGALAAIERTLGQLVPALVLLPGLLGGVANATQRSAGAVEKAVAISAERKIGGPETRSFVTRSIEDDDLAGAHPALADVLAKKKALSTAQANLPPEGASARDILLDKMRGAVNVSGQTEWALGGGQIRPFVPKSVYAAADALSAAGLSPEQAQRLPLKQLDVRNLGAALGPGTQGAYSDKTKRLYLDWQATQEEKAPVVIHELGHALDTTGHKGLRASVEREFEQVMARADELAKATGEGSFARIQLLAERTDQVGGMMRGYENIIAAKAGAPSAYSLQNVSEFIAEGMRTHVAGLPGEKQRYEQLDSLPLYIAHLLGNTSKLPEGPIATGVDEAGTLSRFATRPGPEFVSPEVQAAIRSLTFAPAGTTPRSREVEDIIPGRLLQHLPPGWENVLKTPKSQAASLDIMKQMASAKETLAGAQLGQRLGFNWYEMSRELPGALQDVGALPISSGQFLNIAAATSPQTNVPRNLAQTLEFVRNIQQAGGASKVASPEALEALFRMKGKDLLKLPFGGTIDVAGAKTQNIERAMFDLPLSGNKVFSFGGDLRQGGMGVIDTISRKGLGLDEIDLGSPANYLAARARLSQAATLADVPIQQIQAAQWTSTRSLNEAKRAVLTARPAEAISYIEQDLASGRRADFSSTALDALGGQHPSGFATEYARIESALKGIMGGSPERVAAFQENLKQRLQPLIEQAESLPLGEADPRAAAGFVRKAQRAIRGPEADVEFDPSEFHAYAPRTISPDVKAQFHRALDSVYSDALSDKTRERMEQFIAPYASRASYLGGGAEHKVFDIGPDVVARFGFGEPPPYPDIPEVLKPIASTAIPGRFSDSLLHGEIMPRLATGRQNVTSEDFNKMNARMRDLGYAWDSSDANLGKTLEGETKIIDTGGMYKKAQSFEDIIRHDRESRVENAARRLGESSVHAYAPHAESGIAEIKKVADQFNLSRGRGPVVDELRSVDPNRAMAIANAYERMSHTPLAPDVQSSYGALKDAIKDQFAFASTKGINFQPWQKEGQPYSNSKEMIEDVVRNKHLAFFQGGTLPAGHPLADVEPDTGLTYNDEFRAVHDLFGHAGGGNQFGPQGEERAWALHRQMFPPEAIPALTTETRGQNSWVNFGPHMRDESGNLLQKGQPGYLSAAERPYAEQKAGLMPSWTWEGEGPLHAYAPRIAPDLGEKIAAVHQATEGSTFDPRTAANLMGTQAWSVAIAPELTKVMNRTPDPKDFQEFAEKQYELFDNYKNAEIGSWHDLETGLHHIDIVGLTESRDRALNVAKSLGEKGIFNLGTTEYLGTGFTGENRPPLQTPIAQRLAELAGVPGGAQTQSGIDAIQQALAHQRQQLELQESLASLGGSVTRIPLSGKIEEDIHRFGPTAAAGLIPPPPPPGSPPPPPGGFPPSWPPTNIQTIAREGAGALAGIPVAPAVQAEALAKLRPNLLEKASVLGSLPFQPPDIGLFEAFFAKVQERSRAAAEFVRGIPAALIDGFDLMKSKAAAAFDAVVSFAQGIPGKLGGIKNAIANFFSDGIGGAFKKVDVALGNLAGLNKLKNAGTAVEEGASILGAGGAAEEAAAVGGALSGATGGVGALSGAIGALMNPIGLVVAGVAAIGIGLYAVRDHQTEINGQAYSMADIYEGAWLRIKTIGGGAWDWIKTKAGEAWDFINQMSDGWLDKFSKRVESLKVSDFIDAFLGRGTAEAWAKAGKDADDLKRKQEDVYNFFGREKVFASPTQEQLSNLSDKLALNAPKGALSLRAQADALIKELKPYEGKDAVALKIGLKMDPDVVGKILRENQQLQGLIGHGIGVSALPAEEAGKPPTQRNIPVEKELEMMRQRAQFSAQAAQAALVGPDEVARVKAELDSLTLVQKLKDAAASDAQIAMAKQLEADIKHNEQLERANEFQREFVERLNAEAKLTQTPVFIPERQRVAGPTLTGLPLLAAAQPIEIKPLGFANAKDAIDAGTASYEKYVYLVKTAQELFAKKESPETVTQDLKLAADTWDQTNAYKAYLETKKKVDEINNQSTSLQAEINAMRQGADAVRTLQAAEQARAFALAHPGTTPAEELDLAGAFKRQLDSADLKKTTQDIIKAFSFDAAENEFEDKLKDIGELWKRGALDVNEYNAAVQQTEEQHRKSMENMLDATKTFEGGAKAALMSWSDTAMNAASNAKHEVDDFFNNMTSALSKGMLGKGTAADFSKIVSGLGEDATTAFIKQNVTGPLAKSLGDAIGIPGIGQSDKPQVTDGAMHVRVVNGGIGAGAGSSAGLGGGGEENPLASFWGGTGSLFGKLFNIGHTLTGSSLPASPQISGPSVASSKITTTGGGLNLNPAGILNGLFQSPSSAPNPFQFSFAYGGQMPAELMPAMMHAAGGVTNRPQVALFGEGSGPEAYVPMSNNRIPLGMDAHGYHVMLPGGRSIPAEFKAFAAGGTWSASTDPGWTEFLREESRRSHGSQGPWVGAFSALAMIEIIDPKLIPLLLARLGIIKPPATAAQQLATSPAARAIDAERKKALDELTQGGTSSAVPRFPLSGKVQPPSPPQSALAASLVPWEAGDSWKTPGMMLQDIPPLPVIPPAVPAPLPTPTSYPSVVNLPFATGGAMAYASGGTLGTGTSGPLGAGGSALGTGTWNADQDPGWKAYERAVHYNKPSAFWADLFQATMLLAPIAKKTGLLDKFDDAINSRISGSGALATAPNPVALQGRTDLDAITASMTAHALGGIMPDMFSFADGGAFDPSIRVPVPMPSSDAAPQQNVSHKTTVTMNVHGVRDADSFNRTQSQTMSSMRDAFRRMGRG